ncbi:hypothetical protein LINGRAHAP2_LOCUS7744, partial [Linum grandiflorum]
TLNTNGSVIVHSQQAAAGGVFRHSRGNCSATFSYNLGSCSITRAELTGVVIRMETA